MPPQPSRGRPRREMAGERAWCQRARRRVSPDPNCERMVRASLTPTSHIPCRDSQVSRYSEPVVRTNFVSQEKRQSSIRFCATPVRQRRRNYSEREKKEWLCISLCFRVNVECSCLALCAFRFLFYAVRCAFLWMWNAAVLSCARSCLCGFKCSRDALTLSRHARKVCAC